MTVELGALILDFDGVIIESESAVVTGWRDECAALRVPFDEGAFVAQIGVPRLAPEAVLAILGPGIGDPAVFAQAVRARVSAFADVLPTLPGVRELIAEALDEGVALAVASGARREWVTSHLARLGLIDAFAAVVTREEAALVKPAPDLYLEALRQLGVTAADAVAVEDSAVGVAAARAAGIRCVGVPGPITAGHDLSAADLLLPSLAGVGLVDLLPMAGG